MFNEIYISCMASWPTFPRTKAPPHITRNVVSTTTCTSLPCPSHKQLSEIAAITPANQHHDAPPEYVEPSLLLPHQQPAPAAKRGARQALLWSLRRRHLLRFWDGAMEPVGKRKGAEKEKRRWCFFITCACGCCFWNMRGLSSHSKWLESCVSTMSAMVAVFHARW